ncbi:hypothetical protein FLBR109950_00080 [Flavobacterium branchiophilum]|uniref:Uncharacterized protein n=1 Tax=Flavobacterium branchiophilum (strain FL-15) TaxID=1034807 RepID=G2Z5M3_FLABF|nr:hypothetical protein [Flavobacterium branchiophilum]CCB70821.1 Hypothetical protein FBFL15_2850 [Flavobacterium branchiophilum FL-15]
MRPRHRHVTEAELAYRKMINEWFELIPEPYRMPFSIIALALIFFFMIRYIFGRQVGYTKKHNILGAKISSATLQTLVFMLFMAISTLLSLYYYQKTKL